MLFENDSVIFMMVILLVFLSTGEEKNTAVNSGSKVKEGESQADLVVGSEPSDFFQLVMSWSGSIIADPSVVVIPACKVLSILALLKCVSLIMSYVPVVSVDPESEYYGYVEPSILDDFYCFLSTMRILFFGASTANSSGDSLEPPPPVD
jgi:hypothetical protein